MGITNENVTEREKLEKQLIKAGRKDFLDEVRHLSVENLEARLLRYAKANEIIENAKRADEERTKLMTELKEINASYGEQTRMNKKLRKYIAILLDELDGLDVK